MKSETIDAVAFVRQVRDTHYEALRGKTRQERLEFYRKSAQRTQKQIDKLLQEKQDLYLLHLLFAQTKLE
jgi:hypothetical protein